MNRRLFVKKDTKFHEGELDSAGCFPSWSFVSLVVITRILSDPGDNRGLDIAVPVQHVPQHIMQPRKRSFPGDVVRAAYLLLGDQSESAAHRLRRMVESRFQRDFRIVQAVGVQLHLGAGSAAAKEIDGAAFADHLHRPLPSLGAADGFDHHIGPALLRAQLAHHLNRILDLRDLHHFVCAFAPGQGDLGIALHHRNHVATDGLGDLHEHQPDRASAHHRHRVADFHPGLMQPPQHARQRLGHGRIFKAHVRRHDQHVGFDNAARHPDIFRVGAVVEQQVLAEIALVLGTVETHAARSGIQGHDAHALLEAAHPVPDLVDGPRQFVAEQGRGHNHAGMVAALIHLQVGAAG